MKKILIVNKSFEVGGIQSSMVNMANELSRNYEVHLFVYNPTGLMKERLSPRVKVLTTSWRFQCLGMSLKDTIKTRSVKMIAFRVGASIWTKLVDNELPLNMAIKHQTYMSGYDLAIAYHQEQRRKSVVSGFARVVDRCVEARNKVAWLHFDCNAIDIDSQFNNAFYAKMDKLVCVSESLMRNFTKAYPIFSDKVDYCYNFLPYDAIREKSLEEQKVLFPQDKFVCFSACRLTEEKALVRTIAALAGVLKTRDEVVWYIAGDGPERNNIESTIREYDLEKQVVLIGNQSNPYPYIRNADLVMNVSYHEAAPMAFLESKALGTPVFATRTSSAEELLRDKIDSFICENSEEGIRERFTSVLENKHLVEEARLQLAKYHASNDESILKIDTMTV